MTKTDWAMEVACLGGLLITLALLLNYYGELPATIAVHYNLSGQPDGNGPKSALWILNGIALLLYTVLLVLSGFPHNYHHLIKITAENAALQYRLAGQLLRTTKLIFIVMAGYTTYGTIQIANGRWTTLGFVMLYLVVTMLIAVVYFTHRAFKLR